MDNLNGFVREAATTQTYNVDTAIAGGLFTHHDVRRDILVVTCAALHHYITANVGELMEEAGSGDGSEIIDDHFTGELRGVADDTAVADHTVVADMHVLHQQVAVAYDGLALRGCTATDCDILTDGVVVADLAGRLLTLEFQVLGLRGDAGTWEDLVVVAQTGSEVKRHVIQQLIVVTNNHVFVNHAEWADDVVITQLCLWVNNC